MTHNLIVLALAALIPLIVGSAWYSPLLFQKAWLSATGLSPQPPGGSKMAMNMAILYVLSFFVAVGLMFATIHQFGMYSMIADPASQKLIQDPNSELYKTITSFWSMEGHNFRRYRHGALHGIFAALFFALPLIASCAIFEKRSIKYVLITWGFWLVNFILMGAVICHWIVLEWPG